MPAAAVIPAPIKNIEVVAVKKLVVGFLAVLPRRVGGKPPCVGRGAVITSGELSVDRKVAGREADPSL